MNNLEAKATLQMVLARLESEPTTVEEWRTIESNLKTVINYARQERENVLIVVKTKGIIFTEKVESKPNNRLSLVFSDGSSGEADLTDLLQKKHFIHLQDKKLFDAVTIDIGAICWDDIHIATEYLYALVHQLQPPQNLEQAKINEFVVACRMLNGADSESKHSTHFSRALTLGIIITEISTQTIAKKFEVAPSTVQRWIAGTEKPIKSMQKLILAYLNKNMEYEEDE